MKKKELYGFIIRAIGIYFIINQLPMIFFSFSTFSMIRISPSLLIINQIFSFLFSAIFLLVPLILIIFVIIKAEKIVNFFIKNDSEIQIKEINLKTAQHILFNFLGIFIIISSISILIPQFFQLISDRFSSVDMEVTQKQAWRIAPYLIKLLLGFFLISRAKAIIKFITKLQEPE